VLAGRVHKGAASATIAATPPGGVLLGRVRPLASNFKLPADPSVPVIMVGPGRPAWFAAVGLICGFAGTAQDHTTPQQLGSGFRA
jgi:hypothetical protein